jgi:hypothetical protein
MRRVKNPEKGRERAGLMLFYNNVLPNYDIFVPVRRISDLSWIT